MKRHLLALVPLAVFGFLVILFALPLIRGDNPAELSSALIGKPAPNFILPAVVEGGLPFSRDNLSGQVSLVNFFASWCVPCQAEQPVLMRIAREEGIKVFGVNYKDDRAKAKAWLVKHGNPFAIAGYDNTGRVAIDWGVYGVPETYLVGAEGMILYRHVGPLTWAEYETVFKPLITRASAARGQP